MIQQLYAVEREIQELQPEQRLAIRKDKSAPMLLQFKIWLDKQKLSALPKSPLGKAVTYALNNWSSLCTFIENGELTIDPNVRSAEWLWEGRTGYLSAAKAVARVPPFWQAS